MLERWLTEEEKPGTDQFGYPLPMENVESNVTTGYDASNGTTIYEMDRITYKTTKRQLYDKVAVMAFTTDISNGEAIPGSTGNVTVTGDKYHP